MCILKHSACVGFLNNVYCIIFYTLASWILFVWRFKINTKYVVF